MTQPETVYESGWLPDPCSARDVFAFLLTPVEAFAPTRDPDELAAVRELVEPAQRAAVLRWYDIDRARRWS